MRILIADDDNTCRELLAAVLRKTGYDVVEACDGVQAWAELQKPDAPRLVVLDWVMPEMDGVDVLRRVRGLPGERPPYILMLTAKAEKGAVIAGLEAGANDYLTKPYDPGELQARVAVGRRMVELQEALVDKNQELRRALTEIKTLRGILPICMNCKKIRDDRGYWNQIKIYVRDHTEADFSHGICPECMTKLYPDFVGDRQPPPEL